LSLCSEEGRRQTDRRSQDWQYRQANTRPERRLYPRYQNRQNVRRTAKQPDTNSWKHNTPMNSMKTIPEAEPKNNIAFNIFDNKKVSIVSEGSRVYNTYSGDTVYNYGKDFYVNNNEFDEEGEIYNYDEDNAEYDQYYYYQNEVKY
jgi:hypothetical protein